MTLVCFFSDCTSPMGLHQNGSSWNPVIGVYGEVKCIVCSCLVSPTLSVHPYSFIRWLHSFILCRFLVEYTMVLFVRL